MECIELNFIAQTYEKGEKQPSSHSCTELSKTQIFHVRNVKQQVELEVPRFPFDICSNICLYPDCICFCLIQTFKEIGGENLIKIISA